MADLPGPIERSYLYFIELATLYKKHRELKRDLSLRLDEVEYLIRSRRDDLEALRDFQVGAQDQMWESHRLYLQFDIDRLEGHRETILANRDASGVKNSVALRMLLAIALYLDDRRTSRPVKEADERGTLVDRNARARSALVRAAKTFQLVELFVPKRLAAEELGDAQESIVVILQSARPIWHAYVKIAMTVVWVFIHAIGSAVRGLPQKKSG